jgi:hypothetical protein
MDQNHLNFSHVKSFVNHTIALHDEERRLSKIQEQILLAAWEDLSYAKIATQLEYEESSIKNYASELYQELSQVFGKRITKNSFKRFLAEELEKKSSFLHRLSAESYGISPDVSNFKGRFEELGKLDELISTKRSIFVTGSKGIGKTSLVTKFFEKHKHLNTRDLFVWFHSTEASPEQDIKYLLFDVYKDEYRRTIDDLLNLIKIKRGFVVIDGIDKWIESEENNAEDFLRKLIDSSHQSVLIFTCQSLPRSIKQLQFNRSMEILVLEGLDYESSIEILDDYGLSGDYTERLVRSFEGNPSYIHHGCRRIKEFFGGNINGFLNHATSFAGDLIRSDLEKIDSKLTNVEKLILQNIVNESQKGNIPLERFIQGIQNNLGIPLSQVITALETLKNYSLVKVNADLEQTELIISRAVRKYYLTSA